MAIQLHILGPLEVLRDGAPVQPTSAKQRLLLAVLIVHANEVVSTDTLVDALWRERPPATAASVLQTYVSQVRKVVEPGLARGDRPQVLLTAEPGYKIKVGSDDLDAARFERLLSEGRAAVRDGRPAVAAELLREGLALWRGSALADVADEESVRAEAQRLDALRVDAVEERVEVDITLGRHRELVGELTQLVAAYPLRERLWAQLMLCLYRVGRQSDALSAYQEVRRLLAEELGLDPSAELIRLEKDILAHAASLDGSYEAVDREPEPPVVEGERSAPPLSAPTSASLVGPCPMCGHEVADDARFCPACGTPLAQVAVTPRAARKVVTILFSDVIGSTALGERLDPEALARVMVRYFGSMRSVIAAHGGTIAKFIGDAVMAVFGIPAIHEDDALRAVRAALDMQAALAALNDELERTFGVRLLTRTGVNTGEVLVKDPTPEEGLVVGDAVNTAARLEQAAAPGEILLGVLTYRLVRDAVVAERASEVAAKGKAEPVIAYRLLDVVAGALGAARHFGSHLVGRERERALLEAAYRRSVADRSCQLFTLLGPPGIGKSRLVAELIDAVQGEAMVLSGRCLPYGEGITFWPIGEIVAQAAAISDEDSLDIAKAKLRSVLGDEEHADVVATRVGELIGLSPGTAGPEDNFWGLRTFLEALARHRPLVVMIDDIQWAEPTLLDLIEHIADWSRDVPILLLCPARPELVDTRAAWGGGKHNATSVMLEPLAESEATELLANLLGPTTMPEPVSLRITAAAEGNPLFVEEMFAMLVDDGMLVRSNGVWAPTKDLSSMPVPPTIAALLAARLDRLSAEERAVLQCGSVVGQVFWGTSVAELVTEVLGPQVPHHLRALVRRELIRPDRSSFAGDDAFRFRHLLIRDAAYVALPKGDRADLHEAFTTWLERMAGERVGEYEAILGYHLEQACVLRGELGPMDAIDAERARRGAGWLTRAGRRSADQGDDRSAAGLFARAANLLPSTDARRAELLVDLGRALRLGGEFARAETVLSDVVDATAAGDDRCLHGRALLERMSGRIQTGSSFGSAEELALAWTPVFAAGDDHRGLAVAHWVLGVTRFFAGRAQDARQSYELAWQHARLVGDTRMALECIGSVRIALNVGPTPASESLRLFRSYARDVESRFHEARLEFAEAWALAMQGAAAESRALLASCRATYQELGQPMEVAGGAIVFYLVEKMAGDAGAASEELVATAQSLEAMGETNLLSTVAGMSADALVYSGRDEEAERFSRRAEDLAGPEDVDAQMRWRRARARVLARRGKMEEAERLSREALELVADTDSLNDHADTLLDLAEVLRLAGRPEEAAANVGQAIALYERKENLAMAAQARRLL